MDPKHSKVVSLKQLEGKSTPKVVYFVLKKELLNFSETAPRLFQSY